MLSGIGPTVAQPLLFVPHYTLLDIANAYPSVYDMENHLMNAFLRYVNWINRVVYARRIGMREGVRYLHNQVASVLPRLAVCLPVLNFLG